MTCHFCFRSIFLEYSPCPHLQTRLKKYIFPEFQDGNLEPPDQLPNFQQQQQQQQEQHEQPVVITPLDGLSTTIPVDPLKAPRAAKHSRAVKPSRQLRIEEIENIFDLPQDDDHHDNGKAEESSDRVVDTSDHSGGSRGKHANPNIPPAPVNGKSDNLTPSHPTLAEIVRNFVPNRSRAPLFASPTSSSPTKTPLAPRDVLGEVTSADGPQGNQKKEESTCSSPPEAHKEK